MMLFAEALFRFDVRVEGDTLRAIVRNLSSGPLEMRGGQEYGGSAHLVLGNAAAYEPADANVQFTLGLGSDRVEVTVLLAMLRFAARGTVRVTAQAIVRQAPLV